MTSSSVQAESPPADSRLDRLRRRIDDFRISQHLRRTERALRQRDRPELTAEQRRRRTAALNHLEEYRRAGAFPTNRHIDGRSPCFVGANGTPCAMAYLLKQDGREDLVAAVQASEPTLRLESVDSGPLVEWVEANGLSMDEAARIQPGYPYAVRFATDCGPLACRLAWAIASLVGISVAAAVEYTGYRLATDLFPDNALKRRASLGYVTVMNLFLLPFVALLCFALFP